MRQYIRHPSSVPIDFFLEAGSAGRERLKNVGGGGLCFRAHIRIQPGARIHLSIPIQRPPFEARGIVAWCHVAGRGFEIGVRFAAEASDYALRMVEQICHIEQYRHEVRAHQGRELSSEEAAGEWIKRYAERFPH